MGRVSRFKQLGPFHIIEPPHKPLSHTGGQGFVGWLYYMERSQLFEPRYSLSRPAPPRPGPGENGCPGAPRPRKFSTLPPPPPPPPRPENYPGARIVANVPTSSKVFGSQKLLTSIFSTKGAPRRHVTYNNHPNLT